MKKRAKTPAQKKEVLDRILQIWIANPSLRLGQMISIALPDGGDPFYVEDYALIEKLENSRYLNKVPKEVV